MLRHVSMVSIKNIAVCSYALAAATAASVAGPLQEASITKIINDVRVVHPQKGARLAVTQDIIKDDLAVKTGSRSRAELLFQDKTLTRLGADTFFSFRPGTRDLSLERGTMLLQVPKGLGGAKIRAASITASITGTTVMLENVPGKNLKVIVLEGSLRLSRNDRVGETLSLTAGKMIIMNPAARSLPEPIDVDLDSLVKTSALVNPRIFTGSSKVRVGPLSSQRLIEAEIAKQQRLKARRGLVETNLVILGRGTKVRAASEQLMTALENGDVINNTTEPLQNLRTHRRDSLTDTRYENNKPLLTNEARDVRKGDKHVAENVKEKNRGIEASSDNTALSGDGGTGSRNNEVSVDTTPHDRLKTISSSGPYVVTNGTTIDLTRTIPTIKNGNSVGRGTMFGGATRDGSASAFLFGARSDFDVRNSFDQRFGLESTTADAEREVAVFRFAGLQLDGPPSITSENGKARDLALVSEKSIDAGSRLASMDVSTLRTLFLGTADGAIALGDKLTINAPPTSGFKTLHLYGRGSSGSVSVSAVIDVPSADLVVDAQNAITVGNAARLNAQQLVFSSNGDVNLGGIVAGSRIQVDATGNITVAPSAAVSAGKLTVNAGGTADIADLRSIDLSATTKLDVNAGQIRLSSGSLIVPAVTDANFKVRDGGIEAASIDLIGVNNITLNGGGLSVRDLTADTIRAAGDIKVGGNLAVRDLTTSGDLDIGGALAANARASGDAISVITSKSIRAVGGLSFSGAAEAIATAPGDGGAVELHADKIELGTGKIGSVNLDGGAAALLGSYEGGNGGTLEVGTLENPISTEIVVESPISATTGENSTVVLHGGTGGNVNLVAKEKITVRSTVKVSDSASGRASRTGGNISLRTRNNDGEINVDNSGQLLSLLAAAAPGPGGTIRFTSTGGKILVDGGTVRADRGVIDMRNTGATGLIEFKNANLNGDVVKIGAVGKDGQLLIGGGRIDANSVIQLYAGGSNGHVRFTDDAALTGTSVKTIAANAVTIDSGKVVTIGGASPASVFTNQANYTGSGGNGSTSGVFGGLGASTKPLKDAPKF